MPSSADLSHHFPSLSDEAGKLGLQAIFVKTQPRELAAGTHLIESGQPADSVFFLVSGRLDVSLPLGSNKVEVGTFKAGSIVGEVAVLDPAPASATVVAGEASVVLGLTRTALLELENENPRAASAVLHALTKTLVERTRMATDRLDELRGQAGEAPHHHSLADVLRHLFGARG